MTTFFGTFPAEGTPQYAELVRRQTALGIPPSTPASARAELLQEGVGRMWVPDRKPAVPRPRRSTAARPVAPSIKTTAVAALPSPRPRHVSKRWWQFWR